MQDLNKNQIVLLTLLISFVTSIATGIITTSLLQQAPIEVTRNINSIVEKTIQTVTTPATIISSPQQKEVTTIIVKEEDRIINSINKNIKSIVRINEKDGVALTISFYGIGLVVSKDALIVTDRKTIIANNTYVATMSDGTVFFLSPLGLDKTTNFILFKANQSVKLAENNTDSTGQNSSQTALTAQTSKTNYVFVPAIFSGEEAQLGQTVVALGGEVNNAVAVGRVTSLDMKSSGTGTTTTKYIVAINTDISAKDLTDGSPIFNLSGDIVGIKLSLDNSKSFTPISVLKKELGILIEPPKTP